MKTALILEDLPESRNWLSDVVQASFPGIELVTVDTVAAAIAQLDQQIPDIALVDLGLPDGSGIEFIRALNARNADSLSVVTTIFGDDQHVFPALSAGARGYILKEQSREELIALLRGIAAGQPPLSPAIARRLLNFFGPARSEPNAEKLTQREIDVLTLIAKGYTIAKVADMLGIRHSTAASYVKDIYRKLNVSSRAEAAMEAARLGVIKPTAQ